VSASPQAVIDPMTHQPLPEDRHEDAGCWSWQRLLLETRFAELFTIGYNLEQALMPHAPHERRHSYDLLMEAKQMLWWGELDHAEDIAQRVEYLLIEQRRMARELGVLKCFAVSTGSMP
jgi:hypothetical protein